MLSAYSHYDSSQHKLSRYLLNSIEIESAVSYKKSPISDQDSQVIIMDPWVILPQERMRHMEQFTTVGPKDGFITGAQARGFFMQSGLPPMVLAQIW